MDQREEFLEILRNLSAYILEGGFFPFRLFFERGRKTKIQDE